MPLKADGGIVWKAQCNAFDFLWLAKQELLLELFLKQG